MEKVKRLSLEEFKTQSFSETSTEELEKLTGGIMGACHTCPTLAEQLRDWLIDTWF
jgi:hypothetical protein